MNTTSPYGIVLPALTLRFSVCPQPPKCHIENLLFYINKFKKAKAVSLQQRQYGSPSGSSSSPGRRRWRLGLWKCRLLIIFSLGAHLLLQMFMIISTPSAWITLWNRQSQTFYGQETLTCPLVVTLVVNTFLGVRHCTPTPPISLDLHFQSTPLTSGPCWDLWNSSTLVRFILFFLLTRSNLKCSLFVINLCLPCDMGKIALVSSPNSARPCEWTRL